MRTVLFALVCAFIAVAQLPASAATIPPRMLQRLANVALRLVKLGANVLWYRGGHQAWVEAKLPQVPSSPEPW